ncbi:hypothetical protein CDL12_09715 [Handroanthus impetiginosus]|uniref:Uncharacterized protein n=1 Tax=Handroanthus impetiginosus TaxID=429701 RepID=A0A2G9HJL0_9LAMI|nr:hypothetical protein CDL12_09715 [Handroanthus impetiginosus]
MHILRCLCYLYMTVYSPKTSDKMLLYPLLYPVIILYYCNYKPVLPNLVLNASTSFLNSYVTKGVKLSWGCFDK